MRSHVCLLACLSLLILPNFVKCDPIVDMLVAVEEMFCPENRCKSRNTSLTVGLDFNISNLTLPVIPRVPANPSCCKPCSCNLTECVTWNTCCLDAWESLPTPEERENNLNMECQYPQLKHGPRGSPVVNSPILVKMVTTCPPINKGLAFHKKRCENPDNFLLDTYSKWVVTDRTTRYTYRNTHCASCHGVVSTNFVMWPRLVSCSSDIFLPTDPKQLHKDILEKRSCNLMYEIPEELKPSKTICQTNHVPITRCNETGRAIDYDPLIETACLSYSRFFNDSYGNLFCYLCNSDDVVSPTCQSGQHPFPPSEMLITYSALLKLPDDEPTRGVMFPTPPSPVDQTKVYDSIKGEYLDLSCRFPRTLKSGGNCVLLVDKLTGVAMEMFLLMELADPMTRTELVSVRMDILEAVDELFSALNIDYYSNNKHFIIYANNDDPDGELGYFVVYIRFRVLLMEWELLEGIVGEAAWTMDIQTVTRGFVRLSVTLSHWHIADQNYITDIWERNQLFTLVNVNLNSLPALQGHRETITRFHFCKIVSLLENTSLVKETKSSFYLAAYNAYVSFKDVFVKEQVPFNLTTVAFDMCISTFNEILAGYKSVQPLVGPSKYHWSIIDVVSFVCVMLSVLLSFVTIVVYASFKQLQTQPGINTMILAVYIIITQLSFQLGFIKHDGFGRFACSVLGIWIHFSLMLLITWTCICSFNMYRVFSSMFTQPSRQTSQVGIVKTTLLYTLVCWFLAAVPIISNVAYSSIASGGQDIGYGGRFCYISDGFRIVYVVSIPLCLCLVINIGLYIAVAAHIKRSRLTTSRSNEQQSYIGIYARLSTITGATWVFGLIYYFTGSLWTEYLFVVCNGLQGLFIFFAFVITRRVCILCRMCYAVRFVFTKTADGRTTVAPTTESVRDGTGF